MSLRGDACSEDAGGEARRDGGVQLRRATEGATLAAAVVVVLELMSEPSSLDTRQLVGAPRADFRKKSDPIKVEGHSESQSNLSGILGTGTALTGQPFRTDTELMAKQDEAQAVAAVIDRLAKKFPETPRRQIEEVVGEEYTALNDGPIRDYVPVLIERAAKLRLRS